MEKEIVETWADAEIDIPYGRSGAINMLCPKCSHTRQREHQRTKCLGVDTYKGVWKCNHCGWHGGVLSIIRGGRMDKPKKEYKRPVAVVPAEESDPLPEEAIAWFRDKRAISEKVVRDANIVVTRHWFPQESQEMACVAYPYYFAGQLINVKYRVVSKKYFVMERDAEPIFYGLDDCAGYDSNFCVIVEGEMDKLALAEADVKQVLSVPAGAPPEGSRPNLDYFESGIPIFDRVGKVIIATDGDGPGRGLGDELARRIGIEKCYRVEWPQGCKDANDVLREYGSDILREIIADAKPFPVAGIFTVSDIADRIRDLYRKGVPQGFDVGIPSLRGNYVIYPGYMTVMTGIPSHGKSEVMDQIMLNMASGSEWSFGVFSPENWPWEEHVSRLIAKRLDKPFYEGETPRLTEEELEENLPWMDRHFFAINPESPNLDEILEKAKVLVRREGINGIIIDPWNTVENERPTEKSMPEYIGDCLLKIQNFARMHSVHAWVVAHPRKMNRFDKSEKQPVPDPYDIADSAMFYNRADIVVCVWRDIHDPGSPVEIHVQKVRSRRFGRVGIYKLHFNRVTGRYSDWNGA